MLRKYPSLLPLVLVVSGIITADNISIPSVYFLLCAVVLLMLALWLLAVRRTQAGLLALGVALANVGAAQFTRTTHDLPANHIIQLTSPTHTAQIFGRVADWPEIRTGHTELVISVDSLGGKIGRRSTGNLLLKITDTTTSLQRGDRIEFYSKVYPIAEASNSPRFDYGRYLNLKSVFAVAYIPTLLDVRIDRRNPFTFFALTDRLRDAIRATLYADLSPEAAALASGFLIGETRDIPTGVYQSFRNSGTLHLMAVSGSNVAVVLGFFFLVLQPFGLSRAKRSILLLLVIIGFAVLSYGQPSVVRASVMAALVIGANLLERRYDLNSLVALAMLLILLVDPAELYDVGFQLSFATAWGLILLVPRLTPLFKRYHNTWWYRWIIFPILISGVAQVCSAPLTAYYFERIPAIAVISNLVIVPLASIALILILALLLVHFIWPVLGLLLGRGLDVLLIATLKLVGLFGSPHLPSITLNWQWPGNESSVAIGAFYLLIVLAVFSMRSRKTLRVLLFTALIAANTGLIIAVSQPASRPGPILHVASLPGGVMGLVTSKTESSDLIITALLPRSYDVAAKIILPWLKQHKVAKLESIIILSVQYQAIDNILTLADSTRPANIYLSEGCHRACQQVLREQKWPDSISLRFKFFGGVSPELISEGFYCSSSRVDIIRKEGTVSFLDDKRLPSACRGSGSSRIVILGRPFQQADSDWSILNNLNISAVVCPRIAHLSRVEESDPEGFTVATIPDRIHQLATTGEIDIQLANPLRLIVP